MLLLFVRCGARRSGSHGHNRVERGRADEDGIEIVQEGGEDWSWDVESWGEDDADVTDGHLVHCGVAGDADEEGREGPDQSVVG